jgi:hypothetical protein
MKRTFYSLFEKTIDLINMAIYVIIALAVLGFFWGIVKILFSRENEIAKKEGREFMMYGILTLFVMTSFWGLVNILNGTITVQPEEFIEYKGDVNYQEDDGEQVESPDNFQIKENMDQNSGDDDKPVDFESPELQDDTQQRQV